MVVPPERWSMNLPYQLGEALPAEIWQRVKLRTIFECCKWDIQSEDHCVLAEFPLVVEQSRWQELCALAQSLSRELAAAERELLARCDLHGRLGLPKTLQEVFRRVDEPAPAIARTMRFDFHFTEEGWRISEVNADVPGGFIEASGFTQLMSIHYPGTVAPPDPATTYARELASNLRPDAIVGLLHATAYSDDRQVMQFLGKQFAQQGLRVILASPAHIRWKEGRASIASSFFESQTDALVRFFPAEWLSRLRTQWASFFTHNQTPMSNPASAVLVQSKRFPLVWSDLMAKLPTWNAVLPETRCPSQVTRELGDWVVKPALGRVGEDIAISGVTPERKLQVIHKAAKRRPWEWVAQRRFTTLRLSTGCREYYPSVGVFTINGDVAGAYARIARKPLIDDEAQDIAVLISSGGDNA
jgi:glutathionylspermidine synthase